MSNGLGIQPDDRFVGIVFRALRPQYAGDPLSGEGARLNGGRFNAKGTRALYTSLTIVGALSEATPFGSKFQPTTICAFEVEARPIFDATDASNLGRRGLTVDDLASTPWRAEMRAGKMPVTHRLANSMIQEGYAGILVRSFAFRASAADLNLVLWQYGSELPAKISLVDDEDRLTAQRRKSIVPSLKNL